MYSIALFGVILLMGTTLASNVNLSSESRVEFGQGVLVASTCDDSISITPIASFINAKGEAGQFYFSGFSISGVDMLRCVGTSFHLKAYNEISASPLPIFASNQTQAVLIDSGTVFTLDASQSGLSLSETQTAGAGKVTFSNPSSLAANVYKITLESTKGSITQTQTVYLTGSVNFSSVSASRNITCGLSRGSVYCWGWNGSGALGNGTNIDSNYPVKVLGISTATQVSVGNNEVCALLSNGTVKCWGSNGNGNLGNGTTADSNIPTLVLNVSSASQISVQDGSCALIANGTIKCWGYNYWGNAGDGTSGQSGMDPTNTSKSTPVLVSDINTATQVAASGSTTCALLSDGSVSCWGYGGGGQLGNGSFAYPTSSKYLVTGISNATSIASGDSHFCAGLSTGAVKCWGLDNSGQLGGSVPWNASKGGYLSSIPVTVTGLSNIVSLSLGSSHSCGINSSGNVFCWGSNSNGQLGDNTNNDSGVITEVSGVWTMISTPVQALSTSNVTSIATGEAHTCALDTSNILKCWGANSYGQLGISSNIGTKVKSRV
jgi:alpha-tubulin suppressor-like RCC1 family protein